MLDNRRPFESKFIPEDRKTSETVLFEKLARAMMPGTPVFFPLYIKGSIHSVDVSEQPSFHFLKVDLDAEASLRMASAEDVRNAFSVRYRDEEGDETEVGFALVDGRLCRPMTGVNRNAFESPLEYFRALSLDWAQAAVDGEYFRYDDIHSSDSAKVADWLDSQIRSGMRGFTFVSNRSGAGTIMEQVRQPRIGLHNLFHSVYPNLRVRDADTQGVAPWVAGLTTFGICRQGDAVALRDAVAAACLPHVDATEYTWYDDAVFDTRYQFATALEPIPPMNPDDTDAVFVSALERFGLELAKFTSDKGLRSAAFALATDKSIPVEDRLSSLISGMQSGHDEIVLEFAVSQGWSLALPPLAVAKARMNQILGLDPAHDVPRPDRAAAKAM
jgi:hypothetical protein